jgi:hypothetical protein
MQNHRIYQQGKQHWCNHNVPRRLELAQQKEYTQHLAYWGEDYFRWHKIKNGKATPHVLLHELCHFVDFDGQSVHFNRCIPLSCSIFCFSVGLPFLQRLINLITAGMKDRDVLKLS